MNIWTEIRELEEAKDKLSCTQDRILDEYNINRDTHVYEHLLKKTSELQEEYDILIKEYKELAKEM